MLRWIFKQIFSEKVLDIIAIIIFIILWWYDYIIYELIIRGLLFFFILLILKYYFVFLFKILRWYRYILKGRMSYMNYYKNSVFLCKLFVLQPFIVKYVVNSKYYESIVRFFIILMPWNWFRLCIYIFWKNWFIFRLYINGWKDIFFKKYFNWDCRMYFDDLMSVYYYFDDRIVHINIRFPLYRMFMYVQFWLSMLREKNILTIFRTRFFATVYIMLLYLYNVYPIEWTWSKVIFLIFIVWVFFRFIWPWYLGKIYGYETDLYNYYNPHFLAVVVLSSNKTYRFGAKIFNVFKYSINYKGKKVLQSDILMSNLWYGIVHECRGITGLAFSRYFKYNILSPWHFQFLFSYGSAVLSGLYLGQFSVNNYGKWQLLYKAYFSNEVFEMDGSYYYFESDLKTLCLFNEKYIRQYWGSALDQMEKDEKIYVKMSIIAFLDVASFVNGSDQLEHIAFLNDNIYYQQFNPRCIKNVHVLYTNDTYYNWYISLNPICLSNKNRFVDFIKNSELYDYSIQNYIYSNCCPDFSNNLRYHFEHIYHFSMIDLEKNNGVYDDRVIEVINYMTKCVIEYNDLFESNDNKDSVLLTKKDQIKKEL